MCGIFRSFCSSYVTRSQWSVATATSIRTLATVPQSTASGKATRNGGWGMLYVHRHPLARRYCYRRSDITRRPHRHSGKHAAARRRGGDMSALRLPLMRTKLYLRSYAVSDDCSVGLQWRCRRAARRGVCARAHKKHGISRETISRPLANVACRFASFPHGEVVFVETVSPAWVVAYHHVAAVRQISKLRAHINASLPPCVVISVYLRHEQGHVSRVWIQYMYACLVCGYSTCTRVSCVDTVHVHVSRVWIQYMYACLVCRYSTCTRVSCVDTVHVHVSRVWT